jgi:hypothetical protein
MAKFMFSIYSPYVGADIEEEIEIDDAELKVLNEEERFNEIQDRCREWMIETVEWGWKEIKE